MSSKLIVRTDIDVETLRRRARLERDGRIAARLLAIGNALDGMSRAEAARAAGMGRQTLRDWVISFNAVGVDGLGDRKRSGSKPFLDEGQQAVLRNMVLRGPDPDRDGVSAWRLIDICRRLKTAVIFLARTAGNSKVGQHRCSWREWRSVWADRIGVDNKILSHNKLLCYIRQLKLHLGK